ncbi:helix-turn-helix domain-containing protein [Pseudoclavibacter helvolus]|uniref:Excisionase family DNA binding protein n=1 Tax=Pseudoclavibacter helvolus TaxID=255205 RepID=A0A7W4YGF1_9MICO|nr:helix-turn-helix domain-containing protein [Pseudoclavibacter helvolus]MBB2959569.1 excisionase family DNA binding protein [Pseudoclavibacter helvolus]
MARKYWIEVVMADHEGLEAAFANAPDILTTPELAERLNMTVQGVQKWLKDGVLPGYKVGRTWFVTKHDLLATFQAGANRGASGEVAVDVSEESES